MKFLVVTPSGMVCFESDSKVQCNRYVRQAVKKGAVGLEVVCNGC